MIKKIATLVLVVSVMVIMVPFCAAFGAESKDRTGDLNIFAKSGQYQIFLDNQSVGTTPLTLQKVKAGSHYIKAISGEAIVHEELIEIKIGELTTLVISPGEEIKGMGTKYVEVKKEQPQGPDYSEKLSKGPYLVVGYLSDSYSSSWSSSSYFSLSGSSICYGIGYKYGFVPHLDAALEVTRADLSKNGTSWHVMPIALNLSYSSAFSHDKKSKWYMGMGLLYTLTNLIDSGNNLGGIGYSIVSGYESPAGKDAVFYEYSFGSSSSSSGISGWRSLVRIGYRWNK